MINKPGIYKISSEEYHGRGLCVQPTLSRSTIKDLLFRSPAHAYWNHPDLNPNFKKDDGESKFDIGTASHSMLIESPESIAIIEADDWRTKAAKEERENARKDGKTPLLKHQFDQALVMVRSAMAQIRACKELGITDLSDDGDSELSYIWTEDKTWLRVRPDWISKDRKILIDYKTTVASANPSDYVKIALSTGVDIQASLYPRGVKAIEGIEPKFILVVQEAYEPFLCSFISFTPQFLEMGKSKVDYGIFQWNKCMETNEWPGYPNRICWIEPPAWALTAWESIGERIGI